MESCQLNAIGVLIEVTITEDDAAVDVSTVTTKEIVFRKPDQTTVTKTASFSTNGSNGKINYTSVASFLDVPGVWEAQGSVVFPSSGFNGRSAKMFFEVADNIPA